MTDVTCIVRLENVSRCITIGQMLEGSSLERVERIPGTINYRIEFKFVHRDKADRMFLWNEDKIYENNPYGKPP